MPNYEGDSLRAQYKNNFLNSSNINVAVHRRDATTARKKTHMISTGEPFSTLHGGMQSAIEGLHQEGNFRVTHNTISAAGLYPYCPPTLG